MAREPQLRAAHRARLQAVRSALRRRLERLYAVEVGEVREIPLSAIPLDDARYSAPNAETVAMVVASFDQVPPIRVVPTGRTYRLVDGRHRIEAARQLGRSRIEALVGPERDLDASFASFTQQAQPLITAVQVAMIGMTVAFVRLLLGHHAGGALNPGVVAGRTALGLPIEAGMTPFPAMVKGQIGLGRGEAAAIDYGRYLATRFADSEAVRVADESMLHLAQEQELGFRGWVGVVAPDACDPCLDNEGEHDVGDEMYRHASCQCVQEWVVT